MSKKEYQNEFCRDVFAAELEEIKKRREAVGIDSDALGGPPSTEMGLAGLALSGGGIRSATFSLGIIQSLARKGLLRHMDYLSTVSGGGYIGSCISSLLNDPRHGPEIEKFPLRNGVGEVESPALTHLRNSSNYLSPGGLLDMLRLPNLVLRGILLNLFLFLPYIMAAVFLTEVAYEKGPNWDNLAYLVLPLIIIFMLLSIAFPFSIRLLHGVFNWQRRNSYELWLTIPLLLAAIIIFVIPLLRLTRLAVEHSWSQVLGWLGNLHSAELWKAMVVLGVMAILLTYAGKASENVARLRGKLALLFIGAMGPVIVFAIYLALCLWQINSPFLPVASASVLNSAAACSSPCLDSGQETQLQDPETIVGFLGALFSSTTEATYAGLKKEFEGRGTALSNTATVECFVINDSVVKESACIDNDLSGDWRADNRLWVVNDNETNDSGTKGLCPLFGSQDELEGRDDRDHRCYYVSRVSVRSLRIEGAGLSLFHNSEDYYFFGALLGLLLFNFFFLDVNVTSPHGFYRDRLSRAYLIKLNKDTEVEPNDNLHLSELNKAGTAAPYHLINVALNLQASKDPNLRGRASDFFQFSKHYVGCDRTGYAETTEMEKYDRHLDLGTAMAISGAAAAPNMGTSRNRALVFILTFLNVRLGYWLPNPRKVNKKYWYKRLDLSGAKPRLVWREAVSRLDAVGSHVNLSDGGHIENLGIYGLLRRRCKFIVAIDGEADPSMSFHGLVTLERFARIDLGVEFNIDLNDIRKDEQGLSKKHWTLATINYGDGETGHLLYIKLSVRGQESEYIRAYRAENPVYPHESTADQFFSEAQFEAYRGLGEHIAEDIFSDDSDIGEFAAFKDR